MNHHSAARRRAARRGIDELIRESAGRLHSQKAAKAFWDLISAVRMRSELLRPFAGCRHSTNSISEQTLFGLVNLALCHKTWLRDVFEWRPLGNTHRAVFGSLVRYLIDDHEVPEFMLPVWFSEPTGAPDERHKWYVHFARSGTIRGLRIAGHLDRAQARCFVDAPHHYEIPQALTWGRQRRVSRQKRKSELRVVNKRRRKTLQAQLNRWSRNDWKPLGVDSFSISAEEASLGGGRSWTIRELLTRQALQDEGEEMDHCVGSYAFRCIFGLSSIWSLKEHTDTGSKRLLTIEVDPDERRIVTALGWQNRRPDRVARRIMNHWADVAGLQISALV